MPLPRLGSCPWFVVGLALVICTAGLLAGPALAQTALEWEPIGPGGGGAYIFADFDPQDPAILFTGSNVGGPYRSRDGGASWEGITQGIMGLGAKYRGAPGAMVFHPDDSQTLYKGGYELFKSYDGGSSWTVIRESPTYRVAMDRKHPETLYVSGRPHNRSWDPFFQKTTDGGQSWTDLRVGFPEDMTIFAIEVDSLDGDVYVCSDRGVFWSDAGESTWVSMSEGLPVEKMATCYWANDTGGHQSCLPLALRRTSPSDLIMYVMVDSLYRRTSADTLWHRMVNDNLGGWGEAPYQTIAVRSDDPQTVFAGGAAGLRVSTDGGNAWAWRTCVAGDGWLGEEGWGCYVMALAISESDPDQMLIGTKVALYKSNNGGTNWHQVYTREEPPGSGRWQTTGTDPVYALDIAVDPSGTNDLFVGFADIGFQRSTDRGTTFRHSTEGMALQSQGEDVFAVAIDSQDPDILYGAVYHHFEAPYPPGDDRYSVVVKSSNRGEQWSPVAYPDALIPRGKIPSLALGTEGPAAMRKVYAAQNVIDGGDTTLVVQVSGDGGDTWVECSAGLPDPNPNGHGLELEAARIVVAPDDDDHAFLAVASTCCILDDTLPDVTGGVWETLDGGLSWSRLTPPELIRSAQDVAVSPSDPSILYVAANDHVDWYARELPDTTWFYSGGVYKSTDGGTNWAQVLEDHFITRLAISPFNEALLYAGSADWVAWWQEKEDGVYPGGIELEPGIYRSTDGGNSWTRENAGLDHWHIVSIACDPIHPGRLYAGTRGGGLFSGMDDSFASLPGDEAEQAVWNLYVAPSLAIASARHGLEIPFRFGGTRRQQVQLSLHDLNGRRRATIFQGTLDPGEHRMTWRGNLAAGGGLTSGVYFVRLAVAQRTASAHCMIIR